eukprot:1576067-Prymnesium_polylepis.1
MIALKHELGEIVEYTVRLVGIPNSNVRLRLETFALATHVSVKDIPMACICLSAKTLSEYRFA